MVIRISLMPNRPMTTTRKSKPRRRIVWLESHAQLAIDGVHSHGRQCQADTNRNYDLGLGLLAGTDEATESQEVD